MDNKLRFHKVVVIGSGKLPYECACVVRQHIPDTVVLEYKVTDGTVLEKLCDKQGLQYQCLDKRALYERMKQETEETLVVSAGSIWIIPEEIIAMPNLTIINWHNALLPAHKGRNAEAWSIYAGDEVTGITWHMLTASVDSGDIIRIGKIKIEEDTTALRLFQKQCELGAEVFSEMAESLLKGEFRLKKQEESAVEQIHFSRQIPNNGYLELGWNATEISKFLRAMDYGSLKLLGDMKIIWLNQEYAFSRYKIESCEVENCEYLKDGNLILVRNGKRFILKNIKRKE